MDLGLLVLGHKFLVLMINTFVNTLPNHTISGEVSNYFHIIIKFEFLCNCNINDDYIIIITYKLYFLNG